MATDRADELKQQGFPITRGRMLVEIMDLRAELVAVRAEAELYKDIAHGVEIVANERDAELVAVRAERDALRAVVSEMANMGTWLTFDDDDFYGVLRRAQDALAAAGTGPTTENEKWDWCDTCQMRVRANHAHDDSCGYCSGGPVVNDECPIHGAGTGPTTEKAASYSVQDAEDDGDQG